MPQANKKVQENSPTTAALKTVLLYAVFASLWILLSDALVGLFLTDPALISIVSTLKGWAFVAVTSLLLFITLRRMTLRSLGAQTARVAGSPEPTPAAAGVKPLILAYSVLILVILGAGTCGTLYAARQQKEKEIARLQAIADLKAGQVANWLRERKADAELIQGNVLLAELYQRWKRSGDKTARAQLLQRMESYRKGALYHGVVLLDGKGEVVLSLGDASPRSTPQLRATAVKAMAEGRALDTNLYRTEDSLQAWTHLDFVAPLHAAPGRPRMAIGLLVDPKQLLYRELQAWPIPSATAETVLFRNDNSRVLFLNELRHSAEQLLKKSVSPEEKEVLSVQAIQGRALPGGVVEGIDYRHAPVLGAVRTIPGTDWFLIAKVDTSELYAATKWDAAWIVLVAMLVQFIGVVVLFLIYQRRELRVSQMQRLQQSEKLRALQLLDSITENVTDAVYAKDRAGRFLLFNREASRMTNKPKEYVLGKDTRTLFPQAMAEALMADDRAVMEANKVVTKDEVVETSGGVVTVSSTKGPLHDEEGRVVGIFGVSRDITERKRAEAALQESAQKYRALIETTATGYVIIDSLGCVTDANEEYVRLTGHETLSEIQGRPVTEWTAEWDREKNAREVMKCLDLGYAKNLEIDYQGKNGVVTPVEINATVLKGPSGTSILTLCRDITERRLAEAALRESRERMGLILNSAAEGIYGLDMAGNCSFCNAAGVKMLGYDGEQELKGKNLHALIHHTRSDGTPYSQDRCIVTSVLNRGECVHSDTEVLWRADGSSFIAEYWAHPIRRDGRVAGAVVTFIDITEHRKLEDQFRQAQKMEAIGQLAGGVAHDFNNILSAIIGYGHLSLMKLPEHEPVRNYIEQILQSSERATALTQSLLAFSRKQVVKKELVRLNSVIGSFKKFLLRLLREDIELKTVYSREELTVMADRGQIEQVIMNLVANARDAMPQAGRLTIETRLEVLDESFIKAHGYGNSGEYALFSVSDTGTGMDEGTRRRIFEPFFTTKEQGKGTGLGLAMVYGIIKAHDGFINVYSEPGKGTVFHLYLPLVRAAAEAWEPSAPQAPLRGGTETVLLAEDDPSLRGLLAVVLRNMGYAVIEAENGRTAVEKFIESKDSVRLAVLDGIMPVMNGREAYNEINALDATVRCIFISGYAEHVFAEDGVLQDNVDFLQKPLSPAAFLQKVREVLDR